MGKFIFGLRRKEGLLQRIFRTNPYKSPFDFVSKIPKAFGNLKSY